MAEQTMVEALNLALLQAMEKDKDVVVLGEDVGELAEGVHAARLRSLQAARRTRKSGILGLFGGGVKSARRQSTRAAQSRRGTDLAIRRASRKD